ncbi:N-acetylmuramoyl-L-alanine amidase [Streptomyces sp. NPDC048659]|uniref:N-acetylmuramoyl-L-alanine amidase n=1 Tax=Streptomyces sp. NPDC048659 TaxID=3155489 RepID=UPI0034416769
MPNDHRNLRALPLALPLALAAVAALAGCGGPAGTAAQGPSRTAEAQADAQADPRAGAPAGADARTQAAARESGAIPAGPGRKLPLAGKTIVIDPGHNPGNFRHTAEINKKVNIGTNRKECDTTGTSTNAGYTEAAFTLDVSHRLRDLLKARGAKVVLVHDADRPYGPCIDERARIGNAAKADAVVSVHGDGSASGNRGFHVILPALVQGGGADTTKIVGPSRALGEKLVASFGRATGSAPANYIGSGTGLDVRKDLGGLNLSTVPKVFIECGNMRDPKDAKLFTDAGWRQKAAQGIADGIGAYLKG